MAAMNAEKKMTTSKMTMTFVRKEERTVSFEEWWGLDERRREELGTKEKAVRLWEHMCAGVGGEEYVLSLKEKDHLTNKEVDEAFWDVEYEYGCPDSDEESEEEEEEEMPEAVRRIYKGVMKDRNERRAMNAPVERLLESLVAERKEALGRMWALPAGKERSELHRRSRELDIRIERLGGEEDPDAKARAEAVAAKWRAAVAKRLAGGSESEEEESEEESEEEVVVLTVPQPEERDVIELVLPEPPTRGLRDGILEGLAARLDGEVEAKRKLVDAQLAYCSVEMTAKRARAHLLHRSRAWLEKMGAWKAKEAYIRRELAETTRRAYVEERADAEAISKWELDFSRMEEMLRLEAAEDAKEEYALQRQREIEEMD
jgi:hypothetical protein